MPSYPPGADDILEGVSRTLKEEILPAFDGFARFRAILGVEPASDGITVVDGPSSGAASLY